MDFWITKHEIEELPELDLIPREWYCGYVEYDPTVKRDSEDFEVSEIIFVGNLSQLDGFNSNIAVIGFDAAHINGEKMTANDVREECFNLIEQIESCSKENERMNDLIKKLVEERQDLGTKIHNLKRFIESIDYMTKPVTSEELQYIGAMIEQLAAMKQYMKFLDKRIKLLKNNDMSYFKERRS